MAMRPYFPKRGCTMSIFYRPNDGVAADFIPFYWDGAYHLFYLKDYRDVARHGEGTPWWHLVTRDFVAFEDWGEALPRGTKDEQDLYVFTGSAIEAEGTFHIFYTGSNPYFRKAGKPEQGVMHATSTDLRRWTKHPEHTFFAAPTRYEMNDWRDPFVFWNAEKWEYWMLLAARWKDRPSRRRGLTACAASRDLQRWEVREPFWAPDLYYTHECPDLFRIGDWYYLVYSEFTDTVRTRYRMSRSLAGPWRAPADDLFDDRAYYAAKTAGDGRRRFLFGWLPTREGEKDDGHWQWGGNLVVHELEQQPDGSLSVRVPQTIVAPFTRPLALNPQPRLGTWHLGDTISTDAASRFSLLTMGDLPQECLISLRISYEHPTANFGLLLRADSELGRYYQLRFEPARQRLVFDRWPRSWDNPFIVERPLSLKPGQAVRVQVLLDGTCLVAYADDRVALSARTYDHRDGQLGLFVAEGRARFEELAVRTREE